MSTISNKSSRFGLVANLPEPGVCHKHGDDRGFLSWLMRNLFVSDSATSDGGLIITKGDSFPEDIDIRTNALHILTDSNGYPTGMYVYADGDWRSIYSVAVGETKYYYLNSAPTGWYPTNGTNGTPNIKSDNPTVYMPTGEENLVLHQFRGF